jgi:hypothetical protein
MYMVRDWVAEDHPGVKIVKIFSVGTKKYEIEREKYYALYKKSSSVQARVPDATEAW